MTVENYFRPFPLGLHFIELKKSDVYVGCDWFSFE